MFKIVKLKFRLLELLFWDWNKYFGTTSFLGLHIILMNKILIMNVKISKFIIKPQRKKIRNVLK